MCIRDSSGNEGRRVDKQNSRPIFLPDRPIVQERYTSIDSRGNTKQSAERFPIWHQSQAQSRAGSVECRHAAHCSHASAEEPQQTRADDLAVYGQAERLALVRLGTALLAIAAAETAAWIPALCPPNLRWARSRAYPPLSASLRRSLRAAPRSGNPRLAD